MNRVILCLFLLISPKLWANEFFDTKIEPLLRTHCYECHSHKAKMKAGLALDSRSGWEQGGDSGPAIVPGKPEKSLLIKMVHWTSEDYRMPPKQKLAAEDIVLLEEWVSRGAPDPRKLNHPKSEPLNWWSLQPPKNTALPKNEHPIDWFVRAKLAENGLQPSPEADRRTLARRALLDLHGMLPTPEEVDAFAKDNHPRAWENWVDQLLASPRYGERWARHWLDVIHFADSHGCEHDVKRPHAWRFRDYVIERLNGDVPWHRFVREQLGAGCFLSGRTPTYRGSRLYRRGPARSKSSRHCPGDF